MVAEFKKFLLRGNVVDLAVAVVIGAAFGTVVTSLVDNIINPVIGLAGDQDFSRFVITLRDASSPGADDAIALGYGAVLTALINFVMVAAAIFFLIVKPINAVTARRQRGEETEEEAPPTEAELLAEIRDLLAERAPARRPAAKSTAKRA